jgi:hypothetical protein
MPNARTAQTVFTEMRRLYESGLKSANKSYDTVHASWWKRVSGKAERRNQAQKAAAWALGAGRTYGRLPDAGWGAGGQLR